MNTNENLNFVPKPIDAVGIRPGEGASIQISKAIIQRTTALRAYQGFVHGRDWMEKFSSAYIVALATRSADSFLMKDIQNCIPEDPPFSCRGCRKASIGEHVIRERLFPRLKQLREHGNSLIHHLDSPKNRGIDTLNIKGVFEYCYHLFQDNSDALFGIIPSGTFPFAMCNVCKRRNHSK